MNVLNDDSFEWKTHLKTLEELSTIVQPSLKGNNRQKE